MLPVLISIGPFKIYSMGVFMTLGLLVGLYYWWKLGRDEHWEELELFDAFFLSLAAFFVTGRLAYVLLNFDDLGTVYRTLAFLTYPGLAYPIGILGALIVLTLYVRAREWEVWKIFDVMSVTLSLILMFGFFGALLNGTNPGREINMGLVFPGVPGRRFPVDLWGILISLFTFGMCVRVRKNFRFYTWYKGEGVPKDGLAALIFVAGIGIYYIVRGFLEDGVRTLGPIPIMSITGLLIGIGALFTIYQRSGRVVPSASRILQSIRLPRRGGTK